MKKYPLLFTLAALAAVIGIAATRPQSSTLDYKIFNTSDTVALTLQKSGTVSSNFVEFFSGANLKFAVPSTGVVPLTYGGTGGSSAATAKTALGIQAGQATTAADGTVTNTFATAFTSAPKVVLQPVGSFGPTNNLVSVTTSNFVCNIGEPSIVVHYIAVGAP